MIHTLLIPLVAGLICFFIVAGILHVVMPMLPVDDAIKGIIKLILWVTAFALPAEILRKKARQKQKESGH